MFTLGKQAKKTFEKYKKRAKAKLKRLEKKGINIEGLIEMPKSKEFQSRKEFNQWKREIDKFTDRNNYDFKVKKTKNNVPYLPIQQKRIKEYTLEAIERAKAKQEELKALPVYDAKGNLISTVGEQQNMYKDKERGFIKMPTLLDVDNLPSQDAIAERMNTMKKRTTEKYFDWRNQIMRDNWTNLLRTNFGDSADKVINLVENHMSLDEFVEAYQMFRTEMNFNLYYPLDDVIGNEHNEDGDEDSTQLGELENLLKKFTRNEIDKDLINFK